MTAYLQRLFDRAAGLPSGPAALTPAFTSRSPIAQSDQRLNVPELAESLLARPPLPFDAMSSAEDDGLGRFDGVDDAPIASAPRTAASPGPQQPAASPPPVILPSPPAPFENRREPPLQRQAPRVPAAPPTAVPPALPPEPAPLTDLPRPAAAPQPTPIPPADVPPRRVERSAPRAAAPPPDVAAESQPIPPTPRPLPRVWPRPVSIGEAAPQREPPRTVPEPVGPPRPAAEGGAAVRVLQPVPLSEPMPLPAPQALAATAAALPPRTVTRTEVVMPSEPDRTSAPSAQRAPATAETVSRIGRLVPRRRTHLVFGLRRR